jgi:hypothetical protein
MKLTRENLSIIAYKLYHSYGAELFAAFILVCIVVYWVIFH